MTGKKKVTQKEKDAFIKEYSEWYYGPYKDGLFQYRNTEMQTLDDGGDPPKPPPPPPGGEPIKPPPL